MVDLAALGSWLDLTIMKIFSSLNDSGIANGWEKESDVQSSRNWAQSFS